MKNEIRFSVRVPPDLLAKLDYIAAYEDRSRNSEIIRAIRKHIAEFEAQIEKINMSDK